VGSGASAGSEDSSEFPDEVSAGVPDEVTAKLSFTGEVATVFWLPKLWESWAEMGSDPEEKRNTTTTATTAAIPIAPRAIRLLALRPSGARDTLMITILGVPAHAGRLNRVPII
jgi:hypothetical protein